MNFDQDGFDLKCERGLQGLLALQPCSDAIVIVDVLSFSTAVDIILSIGVVALPYRWKDDSAKRFAAAKGAILAKERSTCGEYTLSPASLRTIPSGTLLVLPSPNGSTLSLCGQKFRCSQLVCVYASAVARRAAVCGPRIAVIPAGELLVRWYSPALPRGFDWIRCSPGGTCRYTVTGGRVSNRRV